MNRLKSSLSLRQRKKVSKEVHRAQMATPSPVVSLIPSFRRETLYQKEQKFKSLLKQIEQKKRRGKVKTSKRTTPGAVPSNSSPKNIHVEGERWIKTLTAQNKNNTKLFQRKALKKTTRLR
jgi:hypothetical protein